MNKHDPAEKSCAERIQDERCEDELARFRRAAELDALKDEAELEKLRPEGLRAAAVASWRESERLRREERRGWIRGLFQPGDGEARLSGSLAALLVLGGPAMIGLFVYAIYAGKGAIGVALLTAAASFAAGALLGFLFGVPRTVAAKRAGEAEAAIEANTNLEQISDWLTKILVGIGLVQFQQIGRAIGDAGDALSPGLGGGELGQPIALTLIASFTIAGFLSAYLYTRLRLHSAFASALYLQVKKVQADTNALAGVQKQLDPEAEDPTAEELISSLRSATKGVRLQAFYLARDQRRRNWTDGETTLVAPTVPVFRALIACEPNDHRFHAELGYSLKDQTTPDFAEAKLALEKAVSQRPPGATKRFWLYEYNLAYCLIKLDDAGFAADLPSSKPVAASVVRLLRAVVMAPKGRRTVERKTTDDGETELIWRWLNRNRDQIDDREINALIERLDQCGDLEKDTTDRDGDQA